jgi:hypothetical protein
MGKSCASLDEEDVSSVTGARGESDAQIGRYAVAFAAEKKAPNTSLGTLAAAIMDSGPGELHRDRSDGHGAVRGDTRAMTREVDPKRPTRKDLEKGGFLLRERAKPSG